MATPKAFDLTSAPVSTGEAVRVIEGVLGQIDHAGRAAVSSAELLTLVSGLRGLARRVDALAVTLVGEADARAASLAAEGTPTTSWLALDGVTTAKEAAGLVFAAQDTVRHPQVRDAALAGEVAVGQARAISKGMGELPVSLSVEQRERAVGLFLEKGAGLQAGQIPSLAPQILALVAPGEVPSRESELAGLEAQVKRAHGRRGLRFTPDGDGSVLIKGSLPSLVAEPFMRMIQARVESERRAGRDQAVDRVDAVRAGDVRTGDQRRADALAGLVEEWLAAKHAPSVVGDRPRVVVVMNETDLHARVEQAGLLLDSEGQSSKVSAGELRRLCCDADLTPVVLGTESEILDVGRTSRLVTPAIRRALSLRDGGCAFPGCDMVDARCEAHHIVPWWAGGATSLSNLILLCPHHHGLVEPPRFHSGAPPDRWEARLDARGRPEFLPPERRDRTRTPMPGNQRKLVA